MTFIGRTSDRICRHQLRRTTAPGPFIPRQLLWGVMPVGYLDCDILLPAAWTSTALRSAACALTMPATMTPPATGAAPRLASPMPHPQLSRPSCGLVWHGLAHCAYPQCHLEDWSRSHPLKYIVRTFVYNCENYTHNEIKSGIFL